MLEAITLGIIQGIVEWLPVSSEGMLVLVQAKFFGANELKSAVEVALFLHLGTFFAVLVYFWKDVVHIIKNIFNFSKAQEKEKKLISFLFWTTIISGIFGFIILQVVSDAGSSILIGGRAIMVLVGVLLLVTAYLQIKAQKGGEKEIGNLKRCDNEVLGVVQGFAALPGLSRSGLTVATLLLRGFKDDVALKLSFLMSLPIVLGGNIALNLSGFSYSTESLVSLAFAFVFGLLSISMLLKFARKVNMGYFVLVFGVLSIIAAFI